MKLLKYAALCLGLSMLLIGCNSGQEAPKDPTLTEAPAAAVETNACEATPDPGPCKAQIEKFYFDPATKKCTSFTYGGCQGTVPFDTMASCQSACEAEHTSAAVGCTANGVEHNIGDSWAQACNTCTCTSTENGPMAVCTDTPCDMSTTPDAAVQTPAPATAPAPAAPVAPSSSATPSAQGA